MEGDYIASVLGKQVTVVKFEKDGTKQVTVKCHPDDTFNLSTAINLAVERLNQIPKREIKIGDKVRIVNNEEIYSFDSKFAQVLSTQQLLKFRYGVLPKKGMIGTVVAIDDAIYPRILCVQVDRDSFFQYGRKKFRKFALL